MREAMFNAKVGDDVYGEDPSVNKLQKMVAEQLNKEAALFVPSGTQSNLIAIGAHCTRGDEAILGKQSHIYVYEGGGASAFMGVSYHLIENNADGSIPLDSIRKGIRPDNEHYPRTSVIALENTHNVKGGVILPLPYVNEVKRICEENKLPLHLDGARLWNASAATGLSMQELARQFDTVSVCLSKGLGAPVGSILAGSASYIAKAKRLRKALGGGMRQSGLLAAAGIYAIENNFARLHQDHVRARKFSDALNEMPDVFTDVVTPETNIVYFEVRHGKGKVFTELLKTRYRILLNSYGTERVRAVMHLDITDDALDKTLLAIRTIAREGF